MLIQRVGERALSYEIPLPTGWPGPAPGGALQSSNLPVSPSRLGVLISGYVAHPQLRPMLDRGGSGLAIVRLRPESRIANLTVPSVRVALQNKLREMRAAEGPGVPQSDLVSQFVRDHYGDIEGYVVDVKGSVQGLKRALVAPRAVQEVVLISWIGPQAVHEAESEAQGDEEGMSM